MGQRESPAQEGARGQPPRASSLAATPRPATPRPATPRPATPLPATPRPNTPPPATPRPNTRLEQGGVPAARSRPRRGARAPIAVYRRYLGYDYSRGASLFITITTAPRRQLFGVVKDAEMTLSPFGAEVLAALVFTFSKPGAPVLYGRVVMPDHVHFRVYLQPGLPTEKAVVYLDQVVGRFKSYTTRLYQTKYGGFGALWQQGFHDWLCLSREMVDAVERYIGYNALKWELRHNRGRLLALREPLLSPRLGATEFWRGVGAVGLLDDPSRRLVALRVSRQCRPSDVAAIKARLLAKAPSLTVLSGFLSGGEREILAALLAEPQAALIKVSPYALPHDYQPGVALMPAIAANRLAVIARGNSPEEISRAACLDLNARIVDIAGLGAYALPGELRWLRPEIGRHGGRPAQDGCWAAASRLIGSGRPLRA